MEQLKIEFRCIQEEDLENLMHWRMQPDITKYMNTDPQLTLEGQRKWYHHILTEDPGYYWIITVNNVKVGLASLVSPDPASNQIHTGVYIAVKEKRSLRLILDVQWNLYAYAFDTLNYHKVCEEIFSENKAVLRILDLCGSKREGELRSHIFKNGLYHDVTVRGILKDEWDAIKPSLQYNHAEIEEYK